MMRRVSRVRTPPASAMSLARWITGPSITGSEYGSSTSMTSQPASAIATIAAMLASAVGNPAGMHPTSTPRFSAFAFAKTSAMLTLSPPILRDLGVVVGTMPDEYGVSPTTTPRSRRGGPPSDRCSRSCVLPRHQRLLLVEQAEVRAGGVHVLVATAGQIHHDGR